MTAGGVSSVALRSPANGTLLEARRSWLDVRFETDIDGFAARAPRKQDTPLLLLLLLLLLPLSSSLSLPPSLLRLFYSDRPIDCCSLFLHTDIFRESASDTITPLCARPRQRVWSSSSRALSPTQRAFRRYVRSLCLSLCLSLSRRWLASQTSRLCFPFS